MAVAKFSRLSMAGAGFVVFSAGLACGLAAAREPLPRFTPLLSTSKTVMDEPVVYPPGTAKRTTGIVALSFGFVSSSLPSMKIA
ncbi:MAG: hypothetical protein ABL893_06140 [Hyphomicrobium sp.]